MNKDISVLDDAELLQAAVDGDNDAIGLLFFRSRPALLLAIRPQIGAKLQRTVTEDDILQETYKMAFCSFDSADFTADGTAPDGPSVPKFMKWMQQIGVNCVRQTGRTKNADKRGGKFKRVEPARDQFAERARELLAEISTGDATVSQLAARTEAADALRVAIASLPNEQQSAVKLRYFDQLAVEQVAEAMDRSVGSVRGLLSRAKAALRTSLHYSALWLSKGD